MNELAVLSLVGGALLLGAMSPGPSFLVTAQTSLSGSRRDGVAVALGVGAGGALFAALALGGLIALLTAVEPLYIALKVGGAAYLLWLAFKLWRGARSPLAEMRDDSRPLRANPFLRGLGVQLSNPKTAVVYASAFASLVPQEPSVPLSLSLLGLVFLVESGWYTLVALGMSFGALRSGYQRAKKWIDRGAAVALAALGVRLLATAASRGL